MKFSIPMNRVIAFFGPYISVIAGVIATWLTADGGPLSPFNLEPGSVEEFIAQTLVFALTSALVWLGQNQWLKGHHIEIANGTWSGDPNDMQGVDLPGAAEHPPSQ